MPAIASTVTAVMTISKQRSDSCVATVGQSPKQSVTVSDMIMLQFDVYSSNDSNNIPAWKDATAATPLAETTAMASTEEGMTTTYNILGSKVYTATRGVTGNAGSSKNEAKAARAS